MAWACKRCNRVVRGNPPDGPLVCGECPEPLATMAEVLEHTDENGDPRIAGDTTIDVCRDCGAWIRRTNNLPRGAAICLQCAVGKVVKCAHPNHKGNRDALRHLAQLGVYIHKTQAGQVSRRTDTLCLACFKRADAVHPTEIAAAPLLALIPEMPYILQQSPRELYPRDAIIFDKTGVDALEEKRIIRFNSKSVRRHEYKFRDVQWLDCEELRLVNGTIERRDSTTFNRRVLRAVRRQVEAKRNAQHEHNRLHAKLRVDPSTINVESLGWILVECHSLNSEGQACFRIEYPAMTRDETSLQWALRRLST